MYIEHEPPLQATDGDHAGDEREEDKDSGDEWSQNEMDEEAGFSLSASHDRTCDLEVRLGLLLQLQWWWKSS